LKEEWGEPQSAKRHETAIISKGSENARRKRGKVEWGEIGVALGAALPAYSLNPMGIVGVYVRGSKRISC
jgi:hypothetical protein